STTGPTTTGNAFSNFPVISSDGGRIAFSSLATDLVPGLIDTNNTLDVFSASGGMLSLVNAPPASPMMTGVAPASGPIMSGDGSTIVFRTEDTRLMLGGMLASVSSLYAADASGIKLASPRQGTPDSTASDISALTGDRSG